MGASVSACLIVKNEADVLGRCLGSVGDLMGEIIIVDTGSTDETGKVAAAHGAKVFIFPWADDFAAARNESLRHATGDWVFWLDADEFLDEINRSRLRELFAVLKDKKRGYIMTQRSLRPGSSSALRVQQVRLFRKNAGIRWEYRVHEQIAPSLAQLGFQLRWTDIVLEHSGHEDHEAWKRKVERNLRLLRLDLSERPEDPFSLYYLGLGYSQMGRLPEAITYLRRSLERLHPGHSINPHVYAALLQAQLAMGNLREAYRTCRAARARCPDDPQLLFLDGRLRLARGDSRAAKICWKQVVHLAAAQPSRSEKLPNSSRAPDSEPPWSDLTERAPPVTCHHFVDLHEGWVVAAHEELGNLCRVQGEHDEAERHWWIAVDDFGSAKSLHALAELYLAKARWSEVEKVAERLERSPAAKIEALVLRGRGSLARQDFTKARRYLESAAQIEPAALLPRVFLTHALLQEGKDLVAAEEALRSLLVLDPSNAEAWCNLGILLRRQNRLPAALLTCQSGLEQCEDHPELLLLYGMMLFEAGDLVKAEAALVAMLEADPVAPVCVSESVPDSRDLSRNNRGAIRARHHLALVYREQGRIGEAEAQWRSILAEDPNLMAAWFGLADLYLVEKRMEQVEPILHILARSSAVEGELLRARIHEERGERDRARESLERVIARYPDAVEPRLLLARIR
jgi:tetratricopeptide (TPR) repeat protein